MTNTEMPERIWLSEWDTVVAFDSEDDCRSIGHTHRPFEYVRVDLAVQPAASVDAFRQSHAELLELLKYWCSTQEPFPRAKTNPFCIGHNTRWKEAQQAIANAEELQS